MSVDKSKIIQYGSNSAHYIIPGDPIPWARTGVNFNVRCHYDAQKHLKYIVQDQLREQHADRPLFQGPLELILTFYMRIPASASGRKAPIPGAWHFRKPDKSNLEKLIEDIGNGILYKDDAQFARSIVQKMYDLQPRVEFTIRELI